MPFWFKWVTAVTCDSSWGLGDIVHDYNTHSWSISNLRGIRISATLLPLRLLMLVGLQAAAFICEAFAGSPSDMPVSRADCFVFSAARQHQFVSVCFIQVFTFK